jgi:hypothetical protein
MTEWQRALRTLMQVLVSTAFVSAVNAWIVTLDPQWQALAVVGLTTVTSYAQNWLEDHGYVRPVLKGQPGRPAPSGPDLA